MTEPTTPILDNQTLLLQVANGDTGAIDYLMSSLQLTDEQMRATDAVPALCVVLEAWLANPRTDLSDTANRLRLRTLTRLINFLTELRSLHEALVMSSPVLEEWSRNNCQFPPAP